MTENIETIQIHFDRIVIAKLRELGLTLDYLGSALFIIFALYEEKYQLLDEFDDKNKERRAIVLYRQLERKGFLISTPDHEKTLYKLTDKALEVVKYIEEKFANKIHSTELKQVFDTEAIKSWISDYINIFPPEFRDSEKDVEPRLENFIKYYGFNKDIILGATKMYIKHQENSETGHKFTRRSVYFVVKQRVSDLAAWCKKYIDNKEKDTDPSIYDII